MYSLSYSHSDIVHNYTGYLARLFPTVWPWSEQKQFLWSGHCVHEQRMAALFGSTSPPLLHEERGMCGVGGGGGGRRVRQEVVYMQQQQQQQEGRRLIDRACVGSAVAMRCPRQYLR